MTRFVQSEVRRQGILLPEYLDDYVAEDNPVRVIDVIVDELDLGALGFDGVIPKDSGRFGKQDFVDIPEEDAYRCPADPASDLALHIGGEGNDPAQLLGEQVAECPLKTQCTTGKERRIKRWEHEAVIDAMQES